MKRALVLLTVFGLYLALPAMGFTASSEISDLTISGVEGIKKGEARGSVIRFKSEVLPDDIALQYYAQAVTNMGRTPSSRRDLSWKKGDFEPTIRKNDDAYEITIRRGFKAPPFGGATVDLQVWITAGGKESNKLKTVVTVAD